MFLILIMMMLYQMYPYIKIYQILYFSYVQFFVYQLFFSKAVKQKLFGKIVMLIDGFS